MTNALTIDHRPASWQALAARFPDLARRLADVTPLTTLVAEDGEAVNIDLGEGLLYPHHEPGWSQSQAAQFARSPDRIAFFDPSHCNLTPVSLGLLDELRQYLRDHGLAEGLSPRPLVDAGFLFVFGVGLGRHLPQLIETTAARRIVLIEPFAEFIWHALSAIDWQALFETADRRGLSIHWAVDDKPETLARLAETVVSEHGNVFLDGSAFYPAYHSWTLQRAYTLLQEQLKCHYNSSGFFEDEIAMINNTVANLQSWKLHVIEQRPHLQQDFPVFLIGAGPSLDHDMGVIKRLRDQAIIVSCGTAIGILLKHGIRPDLHCELERGELVYTLLSEVEQRHGFHGIGLIASTTVDPRVASLFERRWYFFRSALSPAKLLQGDCRPVHGADPLCCNAAFAAAVNLGFRNITLFGLDLGQKDARRHHAKDSVYYSAEHGEWDDIYRKRVDRKVPGNFGGEVLTWWAFDAGRKMLAAVQRYHRANLVNCSDGARIEGARPQAAATLTLPQPAISKAQALAQVEGQMRSFEAGGLLDRLDLRHHIDSCDAFIRELAAACERLAADGGGFWELEPAVHHLVFTRAQEFRGITAMVQGSAISMIRLGHFLGCRLPSGARSGFLAHFIACYLARCEDMAERTKALLEGIGRSPSAGLAARQSAPIAAIA
jgi:hypothetical protein